MTRNERFDTLTTDESQFTSPAQFGNNVIVGEDSNGNPYLEELTNNNRATLQPDGTFDTSALTTNQVESAQEEITGPVVRAFPRETDELNGIAGPTYQDYPIANYNDILDAVSAGLVETNDGQTAVRLPPGDFEASTSVALNSGQGVMGHGRLATNIYYSGSSPALDLTNAPVFSCAIKNMNLHDDGASAPFLRLGNAYKSEFANMRFSSWNTTPIVGTESPHMNRFVGVNFSGGSATHADIGGGIANLWFNCSFRDIPTGEVALDTDGQANVIGSEFLGKGTSPQAAIKIGAGKGWQITGCNFENLSDSNGNPVADAILLGDSADNKQWREGTVKNCNYGGLDGVNALVAINKGGFNKPLVQIHQNHGFETYGAQIDFADSQAGWAELVPYVAGDIANDAENRVVGRTETGDPVVQADDGSAKYQITVDGSGTISTTSV